MNSLEGQRKIDAAADAMQMLALTEDREDTLPWTAYAERALAAADAVSGGAQCTSPMTAADVIAAAQGRIDELAMSSLRGERGQAREWVVRLEGENARLIAAVRNARAALRGTCGVAEIQTVLSELANVLI